MHSTLTDILETLKSFEMPRILIVGATGYVGHALALSLVRSGNHIVYGIARNDAKARSLAQDEIVDSLSTLSPLKLDTQHIVETSS